MSNMLRETTAQITISAPAQAIFQIIAEHQGTHQWVSEVEKVTLLKK